MKQISYYIIEKRYLECLDYEWVNPENITDLNYEVLLAYYKKLDFLTRNNINDALLDDELDAGFVISTYLSTCIRKKLDKSIQIAVDFTCFDVVKAAVFIIINMGCYTPANLLRSYLTEEHASECLEYLKQEYYKIPKGDFRHEYLEIYIMELFHVAFPYTGQALFYDQLISDQQIFLDSITPQDRDYSAYFSLA